jgi:ADP-ribose pyrophosphatase YjhB (NUDIX family)
MLNLPMNFCSDCGEKVTQRIPDGDNVARYVCDACGTIHYQNPKMVVGCIPEWGDQILLCRRAIEPRYGLWTLPAGFMENGETAAQGAIRETLEEAGARVEIDQLYTFLNLPYINQIYVMFRGRLLDLDYAAGTESLEVKMFSEAEIPWKELAFRTIKVTLEKYFADRKNGSFGFHMGDILPPNR